MIWKGTRSAKSRAVVLILAGITAGSLLGGPAGAHVTRKVKHLTKHLDPVYLNETQTAADADKLDNIDSEAFLQSASSLSGVFSCPAAGFIPINSSGGWQAVGGGGRRSESGTIGDTFRCPVHIPNGATVSGVTFTVTDSDNVSEISECHLSRTDLVPPLAGDDNASALTASGGAFSDGPTTLSSAPVAGKTTIDNSTFGYSLWCVVSNDSDLGLYGGVVSYTVPASAG
jgi:hypothetical protein